MAICTFLSHRSPFSKFSRTVSHTGQKPLLQVLPASGVAEDGPDSRQQMRAEKLGQPNSRLSGNQKDETLSFGSLFY